LKNLRWLVPAITAGILLNLSLQDKSVLDGVGLVFGILYLWAAILGAWNLYGRGKL
jgi:hypothetical protein